MGIPRILAFYAAIVDPPLTSRCNCERASERNARAKTRYEVTSGTMRYARPTNVGRRLAKGRERITTPKSGNIGTNMNNFDRLDTTAHPIARARALLLAIRHTKCFESCSIESCIFYLDSFGLVIYIEYERGREKV